MPGSAYVEELREVGYAAGLDRVGVTSAEPFPEVQADLESRRAAGLHGGMQFTYRNPARSTDPHRTLATATTLVVGASAYEPAMPDHPVEGGPFGRVARYATGDYYGVLRAGLDAVATRLRSDGWSARVLADDNALVDRAAAHRAGIGWWGKNANLLAPGLGSWFVLGSVLTDAELPPKTSPVPDGCGACSRCLDACPTGAIVAPGVIDARRCLAWLVQAEGDFPEELRPALGDRIYGCDDCQDSCPPSIRVARKSPGEPPVPESTWVDLMALLEADDDTLIASHGRWYIPRRDPRYLRRNALVALGNAAEPADDRVRGVLQRFAVGPDDLLARHARWALDRLAERAERGAERDSVEVGRHAGPSRP